MAIFGQNEVLVLFSNSNRPCTPHTSRSNGRPLSGFVKLSIPEFLSYLAHSQTPCVKCYGAFCLIFGAQPDLAPPALPQSGQISPYRSNPTQPPPVKPSSIPKRCFLTPAAQLQMPSVSSLDQVCGGGIPWLPIALPGFGD